MALALLTGVQGGCSSCWSLGGRPGCGSGYSTTWNGCSTGYSSYAIDCNEGAGIFWGAVALLYIGAELARACR